MITLPKAPNVYSLPQWNQPNDSDVNGSLWTTTNIDTSSNIGKLRVGDRMLLNTSDTSGYGISSVSEMRLPVVFKAIDSTPWIYTIAGAKLLNNNGVISGSFNTITPNSGSLPTNLSGASDMELFNGYLYTTGNTNVVNKIASLNTASPNITNFTAGGTDVTEKHLTSYASRMYMSRNSSNIISWDTSDTVATSGAYTVELGGGGANQIVWLRSSSNRIWIGTINQLGGKGYIYEWDGTATQVTKSYRLESSGTLSCVIKDDIPYVMDVYGNLLYWNGGTFVKLTGLNRKDNFLLYNPLVRSDNGNRFSPSPSPASSITPSSCSKTSTVT